MKALSVGNVVDWIPKISRKGLNGTMAASEVWECVIVAGPYNRESFKSWKVKSKKYFTTHEVTENDLVFVRQQ